MPDSVSTLCWSGRNICVGFRREYSLIDAETGQLTDVFQTGRSQKPVICSLVSSELLLHKEQVGAFVDFEGKTTREHGISFGDIPNLVGAWSKRIRDNHIFCHPFFDLDYSNCVP